MSERIEGSYDVNDSRQTVESVRGDDDYCGADDYHPGGSEAERPNGRCRENGLVLTGRVSRFCSFKRGMPQCQDGVEGRFNGRIYLRAEQGRSQDRPLIRSCGDVFLLGTLIGMLLTLPS